MKRIKKIIKTIDKKFYNIFVEKLRNDKLTKLMKLITKLGSALFLIPLTIVIMFIFKNTKEMYLIPINLIVIASCNWICKQIIKRKRPNGYRLIIEKGFSFPSGHSAVSMSYYGYIVYLIAITSLPLMLKILIILFILLLILMIGFSRIYLGVHYGSDVLGGYIVSLIYLILFIIVTNSFNFLM